MAAVFLTGFPGFLGYALVEQLLQRHPTNVTIACLVQSRYFDQAQYRVEQLAETVPEASRRVVLIEGDITFPELTSSDVLDELQPDVFEVFHIAAIYDLGVGRGLAMRVNVDGTRNVLNYARACPALRRFHYVSTCYVSGRYPGVFTEDLLDCGQTFNNFYEESKYLAEVDVQQAMKEGMPTTIYRPAIVVGDSNSGATQKFDGPYYMIRWILRWPGVAPVPIEPHADQVEFNLVPRDYVVQAIAYLSGLDRSLGRVYQLADPMPPSISEAYDVFAHATGRKLLKLPSTTNLFQNALRRVMPLRRAVGIEPRMLDYLSHPTRYASANTQEDLEGSGIACPAFGSYADRLVSFMRSHPEISSAPMV